MLRKDALVNILEEMSVLMELSDANPFKTRAIQNGARTLDKADIDIDTAVADGSITTYPGIGKGMQQLIHEYVSTGDIAEYQELKKLVPPGVFSLTKLRGVGAKKARQLHEQLDINSIGELEYACKENRLLDLKGFGEKTQAAILVSIGTWQAAQGKVLLSGALRMAETLMQECRDCGASRVEIGGALRRSAEVIDCLELICCGVDADELAEQLDAENVDETVELHRDAIAIKIHCTSEENFDTSLFVNSASDEFMDAFSRQYKLTMSDEGATEAEIFSARGLQFIIPELRESANILELAKKQSIPDLVEKSQLRGMLHIHSTWSDGAHSLKDMALESKRLGFEYMAICDHSKTAVYANGLSVDRVIAQHREIDKLNKEDLGIVILKGIESDILSDGSLDYDEETLALFDVVVASVHSAFRLPADQQTQRIINAIRSPYTTIVGHPTGRLLLARDGYELHMESILQAAAETGTVIELNANPHRFDLDWRWHQRAVELGVKIAINPDSHQTATLSEVYLGLRIARKGMLRPGDVLNTMSLADFQSFCSDLRARKSS